MNITYPNGTLKKPHSKKDRKVKKTTPNIVLGELIKTKNKVTRTNLLVYKDEANKFVKDKAMKILETPLKANSKFLIKKVLVETETGKKIRIKNIINTTLYGILEE